MSPAPPLTSLLVAVPAYNEQGLIARTIDSVVAAVRAAALSERVTVTIGVAAHRCTDDTFAAAVRALAAAGGIQARVLRDEVSQSVGGVRRRLIDAMLHDGMRPASTWLFSTDADSIVPTDWIGGLLAAAARHDAVAVAGMTDLIDWDASPSARAAYDRIIAAGLTPDGGHRHVYAANLAVRLDAYRAAGGFPSVEHGEDQALVDIIRAEGGIVATPRQPRVRTSGRMPGRAAHGLGELLSSLA